MNGYFNSVMIALSKTDRMTDVTYRNLNSMLQLIVVHGTYREKGQTIQYSPSHLT